MRAWYDSRDSDRKAAEDVTGFRSYGCANSAIDRREVERGIRRTASFSPAFRRAPPCRLYTSVRFPELLAGVSGIVLLFRERAALAPKRARRNNATPIFMAHGQGDTSSHDFGSGVAQFSEGGRDITVEWHEYPMAHAVCAAEIADIRDSCSACCLENQRLNIDGMGDSRATGAKLIGHNFFCEASTVATTHSTDYANEWARWRRND